MLWPRCLWPMRRMFHVPYTIRLERVFHEAFVLVGYREDPNIIGGGGYFILYTPNPGPSPGNGAELETTLSLLRRNLAR